MITNLEQVRRAAHLGNKIERINKRLARMEKEGTSSEVLTRWDYMVGVRLDCGVSVEDFRKHIDDAIVALAKKQLAAAEEELAALFAEDK